MPTKQDVVDGVPCAKAPLALVDHALMTSKEAESTLTWSVKVLFCCLRRFLRLYPRFITSTKNSHAMTLYLRQALADYHLEADAALSIPKHQWLEAPFTVFAHTQEVGELIVFPRRSYRQAFVDGDQVDPFSIIQWKRMTTESIVDAFYEENPIRRR